MNPLVEYEVQYWTKRWKDEFLEWDDSWPTEEKTVFGPPDLSEEKIIERVAINSGFAKSEVRIDSIEVAGRHESVGEKFEALKEVCEEETWHMSSISESRTHYAYQCIIGLGPAVVPHIIEDLREDPNWWFWALNAITGAAPSDPEDAGNLQALADAWIEWWDNEAELKCPTYRIVGQDSKESLEWDLAARIEVFEENTGRKVTATDFRPEEIAGMRQRYVDVETDQSDEQS